MKRAPILFLCPRAHAIFIVQEKYRAFQIHRRTFGVPCSILWNSCLNTWVRQAHLRPFPMTLLRTQHLSGREKVQKIQKKDHWKFKKLFLSSENRAKIKQQFASCFEYHRANWCHVLPASTSPRRRHLVTRTSVSGGAVCCVFLCALMLFFKTLACAINSGPGEHISIHYLSCNRTTYRCNRTTYRCNTMYVMYRYRCRASLYGVPHRAFELSRSEVKFAHLNMYVRGSRIDMYDIWRLHM